MESFLMAEEILFGEKGCDNAKKYEKVNFALAVEGDDYNHFGPRSLFNTNVGQFIETETAVEDKSVRLFEIC